MACIYVLEFLCDAGLRKLCTVVRSLMPILGFVHAATYMDGRMCTCVWSIPSAQTRSFLKTEMDQGGCHLGSGTWSAQCHDRGISSPRISRCAILGSPHGVFLLLYSPSQGRSCDPFLTHGVHPNIIIQLCVFVLMHVCRDACCDVCSDVVICTCVHIWVVLRTVERGTVKVLDFSMLDCRRNGGKESMLDL